MITTVWNTRTWIQASLRLDWTQQHWWVICLWFSLALTLQGHPGNPIPWGLTDAAVLLASDTLCFFAQHQSIEITDVCRGSGLGEWEAPTLSLKQSHSASCLISFTRYPGNKGSGKIHFIFHNEFLSVFFWGNKKKTSLQRNNKPWMRFVGFNPYHKNN